MEAKPLAGNFADKSRSEAGRTKCRQASFYNGGAIDKNDPDRHVVRFPTGSRFQCLRHNPSGLLIQRFGNSAANFFQDALDSAVG